MFFLLFLLDDRRIRIHTSDLYIRIRIQEPNKHMDPTDPDPQHWCNLLPCRHRHPSHCWTRWGQWVQSSPWCRSSSCWQGWEGPTPCSQTTTFSGTHKSPSLPLSLRVLLCFSFQKSSFRTEALSPLSLSGNCYSCSFYEYLHCLLSLYHTKANYGTFFKTSTVTLYFSFCLPEIQLLILWRLKRVPVPVPYRHQI